MRCSADCSDEAARHAPAPPTRSVHVCEVELSSLSPPPCSYKDLLNTRSITTIGQQTHHVAFLGGEGDAQSLQVG